MSIPVDAEAMQLEPGTDNYKDVCDWVHGATRGAVHVRHDAGSVIIDGSLVAAPGDWVVRLAHGFVVAGGATALFPDDQPADAQKSTVRLTHAIGPWRPGERLDVSAWTNHGKPRVRTDAGYFTLPNGFWESADDLPATEDP
jgi:hypothetical protein